MSHDSGGEKTEKPTHRRLQQARDRGQVAKSSDLNSALVLSGAMLLLTSMGPYTFGSIYGIAKQTFSNLPAQPLTESAFLTLIKTTLYSIVLLTLPFFLGTATIGVLSNLLQVKPLLTFQTLKPSMGKLNPLNGFKRILSMRSLVELLKGFIKMAVVGGAGHLIIQANLQKLLTMNSQGVQSAWAFVLDIVFQIGLWACALFFVLGLLDWGYQIYEHQKQLKMSRHEVKQERKEEELDPSLKGRMRQMGIQMTRKRQLTAVPKADVVVTNPTHFAVAIQYDPDLAPAPRVIAKGQDHFALKIKEVALSNGVPIVENKPLARTLYAAVDVDRMVPADMFLAVAEVLAFVFSKNKGRHLNRKNPRRPNG